MRFSPLLSVAAVALLASTAVQTRPVSGARIAVPNDHSFSWERGSGRHHGFSPVFVVEREVPVVVVKEVPAPPPPAAVPLPKQAQGGTKPRKPYVIGASYASLPGGCMKWIEGGASYYYCGGGEWYRQLGKQYRAVARP